MLNATPENLLSEIRAAERARKPILDRANRAWDLYMGSDSVGFASDRSIENLPFELINILLPNVIFTNPKVNVTTSLPHSQRIVAESQSYVLNRWVRDVDLAAELEHVAYEFLFSYGVLKMSIQSQPGYDDTREFVPMRPFAAHIRSDAFIIDPKAYTINKARYMGDCMLLDRSDLEADPRVNKKTLQTLVSADYVNDDLTLRVTGGYDSVKRDQVKVYEIWVPEKTLTEKELPKNWRGDAPLRSRGYNGTIYTMAMGHSDLNDKSLWVRDPRPFYGPPWGPYTVFGAYWTRKWPLPMSALSAVVDQAEENNQLSIANSNAARNYKRFVITDSPDRAKKMVAVHHSDVVSIPGFDNSSATQFEIGGVTSQMLNHQELAQQRLDRNIGLGGALRSAPQKGVTATAESISEQQFETRSSWMESRFMKGVNQVLRTASWYFHYTPEMVYGIGDQKTGMEGTFIGGESLEDIQAVAGLVSPDLLASVQESIESGMVTLPDRGSWWNLEIEVDMYSTRNTNEALEQRRAMDILKTVTELAAVMPQAPFIAWDELLDMAGERLNKRSLGSYIDLDMLQKVSAIQMASGITKSDAKQDALSRGSGTRLQGLQNSGTLSGQQKVTS